MMGKIEDLAAGQKPFRFLRFVYGAFSCFFVSMERKTDDSIYLFISVYSDQITRLLLSWQLTQRK